MRAPSQTARKILLRREVIEPWKSLVTRFQQVRSRVEVGETPKPAERVDLLKIEREQIQTVSWLILFDLARYLPTYLQPVWRAVLDPAQLSDLNGAQMKVHDALDSAVLPESIREEIWYKVRISSNDHQVRTELYDSAAVPRSLRDALVRYGDPTGHCGSGTRPGRHF